MNLKFKETWYLGMLPGRGWKLFSNETIEEVTIAAVKKAFGSSYSSASARQWYLSWSFCASKYEKCRDKF